MLRPVTSFLRRTVLACLLGAGWFGAAFATELTAYTEQWPPYNFAEGGEVKGVASDVLRAACELSQLRCTFELVPWARAYKAARQSPNTLVYTTARKPSREAEFIWIGPILPRTTWVYGRAGAEGKIRDFKDLARLRVGAVRDEAAYQDLLAVGVPENSFLLEATNANVLKMLLSNMVDVMVDTEVGMAWNLHSAGVESGAVAKLMKLSDDGAYYFALNLKSDPALARALQASVDKLRRDGRIDAIVRQYTVQAK
jgi:polar amino acid transport system substrate-binding protein